MPSINSTVVRALNTFGLENLSRRNSSTPNSQPSSPLKKEGFVFPSEDIQSQALFRRMDRMIMERNQVELGQTIKRNAINIVIFIILCCCFLINCLNVKIHYYGRLQIQVKMKILSVLNQNLFQLKFNQ